MKLTCVALALLLCLSFVVTGFAAAEPAKRPKTDNSCMMVMATNIAKGEGNFFLYYQFSRKQVLFRKGDVLEYDLLLADSCPSPKGGLDVQFEQHPPLYDAANKGVTDQNEITVRGDALLTCALGKWYHREIPMDFAAGWQSGSWQVAFEGDEPGTYVQFLADVRVRGGDGKVTDIKCGSNPRVNRIQRKEGYSLAAVAKPVSRDDLASSESIRRLVAVTQLRQERMKDTEELETELALLEMICKDNGMKPPLEARRLVEAASDVSEGDEQGFRAAVQKASECIRKQIGPRAKDYTGYLVGHAHIDAQYRWQWPETLIELNHTFGQMVKFMKEYPGFTFTQSSPLLYQMTEKLYPDLFAQIKQGVEKGQWELAGGRIVEADTNVISPEAHARQFLYGQRYFREKFNGRQALVGWEPDTFGHNWQMPQICRLGGCKYYYYCRGGEDNPLFWWQGADGSRMLCFREINSFYNSPLSKNNFSELLDMNRRNGIKDMMWVYGVGNHGGGPTREYLKMATDWMSKPWLPKVKFATATEYFQTIEKKYPLTNLPVERTELNPVFEGCYTTNGDMKRWNSDAQAIAESSEAIAAIAAGYGFNYPRSRIRSMWEDTCWSQFHDTMAGTAIHSAYKYCHDKYAHATSEGQQIATEALAWIGARVNAPENSLLVFNPTSCVTDADVVCTVPGSLASNLLAAVLGDEVLPVQALETTTGAGLFRARAIPAYGYKVYQLKPAMAQTAQDVSVSTDGTELQNSKLVVRLDPETGVIRSLYDKKARREFVATTGSLNRLEAYLESAEGASCWRIGKILGVEELTSPVTLKVIERGPARVAVEFSRPFRKNVISQCVALSADSDMVDCELTVDWAETGRQEEWPFLKLAMDVNVQSPEANFEIPFGNITRPRDGREMPAIKWADLSGKDCGFSLINDCKHGHSASGQTLRLSIVRSPGKLDWKSDNYRQTVHYALYPHSGTWKEANTVGRAFAWLHPVLLAETKPVDDKKLPLKFSFVSMARPNAMITAVKRSEDDNDLVVRFYECLGTPGKALLHVWQPVQSARETNFLEDPGTATHGITGKSISTPMHKYEIKTLKIRM